MAFENEGVLKSQVEIPREEKGLQEFNPNKSEDLGKHA